jgi:opacity protein-like surface antigen
MKKTLILLAAFGLLTAGAFAQTFSLKLQGGWGTVSGGDLSAGLRGQNDYLVQTFQATSAFLVPRTGLYLSGEFLVFPWKHFGFGFGGGYLQTTKSSSVSYSYGDLQVQETIKPRISAIPVTLSLHYNVSLSPRFHVDLSGGAGLYLATLDWDYRNAYAVGDIDGTEHYTFRASKSAVGLQGGLGLEYSVTSTLAIVLGVSGRAVSIGPFDQGAWTDQWTGTEPPPDGSGTDHTFWYYDWNSAGRTFPQIAFQADPPTGDPSIANVRTASVKLDGMAVTIGLRFAFGH